MNPELHQLRRLKLAVDCAIAYLEAGMQLFDVREDGMHRYNAEHPNADFVLGDFDIRDREMRRGKAGPSPGGCCPLCLRLFPLYPEAPHPTERKP